MVDAFGDDKGSYRTFQNLLMVLLTEIFKVGVGRVFLLLKMYTKCESKVYFWC